MWHRVPVLDLEQFNRDHDNRIEFANSFGMAMTTAGFVRLRGHGVNMALLADCYRLMLQFFTGSDKDKMSIHRPETSGQRGFTPFGIEHAKDKEEPDLKEFIMVGPPHYGENPEPPHMSGFNRPFLQLMGELDRIGLDCMRAAAIYFGLDDDFFAEKATAGNSSLRLLHYPIVDEALEKAMPGSVRSADHEDINGMTLMPSSLQMDADGNIVETENSGLQIKRADDTWVDVPAVSGEIIVNIGDMLQRFTNKALKSTTHRVINPPSDVRLTRRFSMPYFLHFRKEVVIDPPDCFRGDGWSQPEPPITAIDYLMQRLKEINLLKQQTQPA